MRSQLGSLVFVGLMALAASQTAAATRPTVDDSRESASAAPVAVQRVGVPATGLRDEAAMVLVGTALIGLAAAVRRAA